MRHLGSDYQRENMLEYGRRQVIRGHVSCGCDWGENAPQRDSSSNDHPLPPVIMSRAKHPSSAKARKLTTKATARSVKNSVVGAGKASRSPVLGTPITRPRLSPTERLRSKAVTSRPSKAKHMLPSTATFQPGWRPRTDRQKRKERLIEEAEQATSDLESASEDEGSEVGSDDEDLWAADLTLIGENLEEEEDEEASRNEALIESLKSQFAALSVQMRNEMIHVLSPATEKIKSTNIATSAKDEQLKAVLVGFQTSAFEIQSAAEERATALKDVMSESQAMLKRYLKELEAQYIAREQHRNELRQTLEDMCGELIGELEAQADACENDASQFEGKGKKITTKPKIPRGAWEQYLNS
ncbi:hypothetical protein CALCODRAFT_494234 [Calocera cornea HHB12733]|uniref:Uncharacterized protein n=1 Tax=Calocera cornea HHB12733 TaxID=1353952 RepID=A0A165H8L0_9BASI|nr:hypothetical protein CALCODRAFT_494234 [Calocera cornea HHB12733]